MKVTRMAIREGTDALSKILGTPKSTTGAYRLSKITAKLMAENKHIEKTRVDLVHKYGEQDKKEGNWNVLPANTDKFNEEFDAFIDTEVDLENINPIPFKMLLGIGLSAIDMARIATFVEEPTEEEIEQYEKEEEAEARKLKETPKTPITPQRR